ncbi:hypothetical protein HII31_03600 [Pseudocercospora fuligena]|uniref:Uncharacterized protein n=1 Tax=Pseudocercospora fuligena TaxID=685502 RepID=A0A8H6VLX3_9PEZI|nr:hypothetical protein HII31_03600 [Pseudocercospora fuligena]
MISHATTALPGAFCDLSHRSLSTETTLSAAAANTQQPSSKSGSLKRKAECELNAGEEGGHKGRKLKALKVRSKSSAGTSTLSAEAAPQFDLDGLLVNGNLPRSGRAAKPEAIDPALLNGSHDHAPTTQKSAGPIPCPAPEDLGLDRLSDAGMAQAVRTGTLARAYSNEEKKAFLQRKTGQSQYRLRKESLEAEIRKWYHTTYEPYLAANRPYEERKAKRRAKLAARKASGDNQNTIIDNGKTVIVLDDDDIDDDDCAPPALGEEEQEQVRQALRGAFGKNGKHSVNFSNAPAAGRVSQASRPTGISKMTSPPAVASKPKRKRPKKEVVAVDAITDEGERAELQRAQMAMYEAARANLKVRAEQSPHRPASESTAEPPSLVSDSGQSHDGHLSRLPEIAASQPAVGQIYASKSEKGAATPVRNATPSAVIDLTTPPHQQPSSPPYRPQSPIYRNAPSVLQCSSPAMGDQSESYQAQSPGYGPMSPSFSMVDVFADNAYVSLLDDEELRDFQLLAGQ